MFGTLKPVYNKLNQEEKSFYKLYYCGLCSSLNRLGGPVLRMGLSYDVAFMYMMLDSGNEKTIKKCYCPGKIVGRRRCIDNEELADYMAAVSLILIHGKCRDNITDNEKIIESKMILKTIEKKMLEIQCTNEKIVDLTQSGLSKINMLERKNADFKEIADEFGIITGKLFEMAPGITEPRLYYKLGYYLGIWIYIADAALDIREDVKKTRFNPFMDGGRLSLKEAIEKYEEEITDKLFESHDSVVDILNLIDSDEEQEKMIKAVSLAMDAAEGNIFKIHKEIENAK